MRGAGLIWRRTIDEDSRVSYSEDTTDDVGEEWLNCMYTRHSTDLCSRYLYNNSNLELSVITEASDDHEGLGITNASATVPQNFQQDITDLYRIVVPILLTACFLSFVFNLVIVCSVRWIRRRLSPTIYLSLSLAMADAFASLIIGIGLVINSLLPIVYGYSIRPMTLCFILFLEAFRLGGLVISVLHLLALAVNHYIGILRPLHYAHMVTRRTAMVAIVATWFFPLVFFLIYFSSVPNDGFQSENCSSYNFLLYSPFRVTTSLMFFVPLLLMSVMYGHMFVVVRQHQKGLLQCPSSRQLHKNVKAIITTLLILGTYVLGWMPAVLFFILTCLDCLVPFTQISLWVRVPVGIFINSMIVAKSFVDPIIYVVRMPEIKMALKSIWNTKCGYQPEDSTPSHSRTDTKRLTLLTSRRKSNKTCGRNGSCPNGNTMQAYV
ncbi:melanocortin receptor 5-like [Uloborus diversus]|uniref:melanocortin receptor 5-like n=1 Tax=Uloborus diversus TaxID=327109 RepID=UPI00240917EB|nr:melanocortin receptor 5-like [Uloborus diversus]